MKLDESNRDPFRKEIARLIELAKKFDDFNPNSSREEFRDYMNIKTGLNVCHIRDKKAAIRAWIRKLEENQNAID